MSDSAFDDNDPSVYKSHILYVLPKDPNCEKLIAHIESLPIMEELFIQDASKLSRRPPWLDGVPILVNKADNQAHKGQRIFQYVSEWEPDSFLPAGSTVGGFAAFGDDFEATLGSAGDRKFASLYSDAFYNAEEGGGNEQPVSMSDIGSRGAAQQSADSGHGGGLSEKDRRRRDAEVEMQSRTQRMIDARSEQDKALKQRHNRQPPSAQAQAQQQPSRQQPPSAVPQQQYYAPPVAAQPQQLPRQQYMQPQQPPQPQYAPAPVYTRPPAAPVVPSMPSVPSVPSVPAGYGVPPAGYYAPASPAYAQSYQQAAYAAPPSSYAAPQYAHAQYAPPQQPQYAAMQPQYAMMQPGYPPQYAQPGQQPPARAHPNQASSYSQYPSY